MKIDFVIAWVDGNDENWIKEKNKYQVNKKNIDASNARYRDWDLLKYWFRGVEKFAPWVNKIYFVTCGQYPEWLNKNHEKLVLMDHDKFIPEKYLPTFSANPIELNFHRIKGLSEHFVYFNDDMFLISDVSSTDFFRKGLPCGMAVQDPISPDKFDVFNSLLLNDITVINKLFDRKEVLKKHWAKFYFSPSLRSMIMNWSFLLWKRNTFFGLEYSHLPSPFLKSAYNDIWKDAYETLDSTCMNKFRSVNDVNQYVIQYYQYVTGNFSRYNWKKSGTAIHLSDCGKDNNIKSACDAIENQKFGMVCLNDVNVKDFDGTKKRISESFDKILNEKSRYEL